MAQGSVITVDAGVLTLARLATTSKERRRAILPHLLQHLCTCRPKDVPQHAEKIAPAVDAGHRNRFVRVLKQCLPDMSVAQASRVKRVIEQMEKS